MRLFLVCFAILTFLSGHTQISGISDYVMSIIYRDADKETAKMLEIEKTKNPNISEAVQKFATDTFRINYLWKRKIEFVSGRNSRVVVATEALDSYKFLMEKLYVTAIGKIKINNKAVFEEDQKKWQTEYDEVEKQLTGDNYDMYKVRQYEVGLVKERVVNLFQYTQGLK